MSHKDYFIARRARMRDYIAGKCHLAEVWPELASKVWRA